METASKEEKSKKDQLALVAGGANFLGAALSKVLLEQGYSVICLDNLSHSSKANIEELLQNSKFTFVQEDFSTPTFKLAGNLSPSFVFHLASLGTNTQEEKPSLNTLLINSVGTKNLLDIAVEKKAKFVFLSSPDVFQAALPQTSLNSFFAKDVHTESLAFAEGKRFGEILIAEYYKKFDLDTSVVRIKDPYGPGMGLDGKSTMSHLISQALEKKKIAILGDGLQTANPTFASDIVDGLLKVALSDTSGEIFQLINPDRFTEKAIAQHLKLIIGDVEIVQKKKAPIVDLGQPLILEETQEKLGWSPRISLEEGLNQTVAFFRQEKPKEVRSEYKSLEVKKEVRQDTGKRNVVVPGLILLILAAAVWLLAFPATTIALNLNWGNENLSEAVKNLTEDGSNSSDLAKKAERNFATSQASVRNLAWVGYLPWWSQTAKTSENYLFLAESLAKATKYTSRGLERIEQAVSPNTSVEQTKDIVEEARQDFEQAEFLLATFTSIEGNVKALPFGLKAQLAALKKQKETLEKILEKKQAELESVI